MQARDLLYYRPSGELRDLFSNISAAGWNIHIAQNSRDAIELIEGQRIRVGVAPLRHGADLDSELETLSRVDADMAWVALLDSEYVSPERVSQLIAKHFFDYHTLPVDERRLLFSLGHAYGMAHVHARTASAAVDSLGGNHIVGSSRALHEHVDGLRKVAAVDAPVLVSGENGSGKELAARTIHDLSARRSGPFLVVNCASLKTSHAAGTLFGIDPAQNGSADAAAERVDGGTLFLDHVDELSPNLQLELLRLLQDSVIREPEASRPVPVSVRIIAATETDLRRAVEEGRFRRDLFDRLNVLHITVPPLRRRPEDVEPIAQYYFRLFSSERKSNVKGFSTEALAAMCAHSWPGNVRELINRVRRAIIMSNQRLIAASDLDLDADMLEGRIPTLKEVRAEAESRLIRSCLDKTRKNVTRAARELGVSRVTLYRLMEKHRIGPVAERNGE